MSSTTSPPLKGRSRVFSAIVLILLAAFLFVMILLLSTYARHLVGGVMTDLGPIVEPAKWKRASAVFKEAHSRRFDYRTDGEGRSMTGRGGTTFDTMASTKFEFEIPTSNGPQKLTVPGPDCPDQVCAGLKPETPIPVLFSDDTQFAISFNVERSWSYVFGRPGIWTVIVALILFMLAINKVIQKSKLRKNA